VAGTRCAAGGPPPAAALKRRARLRSHARAVAGMRSTVTLLCALFAALFAAPAAGAASAASAIDDAGHRVALARPAQRIVALAPHITEQLFAIGAGHRIVGTTDFADHPPAARAIVRVARAHHVDLEAIAALEPDLIVVWGSGYPPAVIEALRRLRAPVYVQEPGTLDGIATSMLRLGVLAGTTEAAERAAAQFRQRVEALRGRYAERAEVRVFYQVWWQPLMTLSGRHVVSEAIRLCGGRNVFEALVPIAPQVSIEAVIAADPQLIATAEPGGAGTALDPWRRYRAVSAVRAGQLVTLDADRIHRNAPRMVEEIEVLCRHIEAARSAVAGRPSR